MDEIALHLLDIAMNAIGAGAKRLVLSIEHDRPRDRLSVTIADDGKGMDGERLAQVLHGFASDRTPGRRLGLGLALLRQTAESCDGAFEVHSAPGQGTRVQAWMRYSHPDRPPIGSLEDTVLTLCVGAPDLDVELACRHEGGPEAFFSSAAVRRALGGSWFLQEPGGIRALRTALRDVVGRPGCAEVVWEPSRESGGHEGQAACPVARVGGSCVPAPSPVE